MEQRDRRAGNKDFGTTASHVLAHLRATVGLDMWLVGRLEGDDWVVLRSEGVALEGTVLRWADTLCARVADGRAQWATPDVDEVPTLVEARELLGLPIRSYVTVPLRGDNGQLLGTLWGAGILPRTAELAGCRPELDVLAALLGPLLDAELRRGSELQYRQASEQETQTDPLTELGNRRGWDRAMAVEEGRIRNYGGTAAVLTIDVEGLKGVNARWGHEAGDALLQKVADVLRREARPADQLARLGGDDFAVLLPEADANAATRVAERLRKALVTACTPASVGSGARATEGLAGAWRDADHAMYAGRPARPQAEPLEVRRSGTGTEPVMQELLGLARAHTGADIAFLFLGRIDGPGRESVADSRPPLPIGGYLGVPVRLPEGPLYGTLSCVSKAPRSSFDGAAVAFLTAVAASLSRLLAREEPARVGRRQLLADIDDVLASDGLQMAYQPIVDLATGDLRGVEALARFGRAGRSTEQWFTDAATVDRGSELELETARTALAESADWPGELWLNLSASVLVSPAAEALLEGRELSRVVLEISEREQVASYTALRHSLERWRARGLRLAVDDAGAGFSSLRHVLELAPDVIKLDISLVRGLPSDPARRAMVAALVAFARESGAVVLGEGVQDEAELSVLRAIGVTMAQGFHLGKPVPAGAHEQLMRTGLPSPSNRRELLERESG